MTQLVLRERQSRDRGWWDEWADCFAGNSIIDMSWFRGRGRRVRGADACPLFQRVWGRHRLSPPAVRVNGDRAAHHVCLYERDSLTATVPGQVLNLDPNEFGSYRPSYRALAWYLARVGVTTPDTLLGDDEPEPVARLYQAEHAWQHHQSGP